MPSRCQTFLTDFRALTNQLNRASYVGRRIPDYEPEESQEVSWSLLVKRLLTFLFISSSVLRLGVKRLREKNG